MPGGPSVAEPHAQGQRTMAEAPVFGRGQSQRLLTGFLEHILDNRASKRFAVLERAVDSDEVYLKLYRDRDESTLRKIYTFNKTNFVGTERGSVKRHSKYPVLYWAIILTTETVLFQDARHTHVSSEFERWNDLIKELWRHQSWMVKPVYGISQSNEKEFVLHLNKVSLGLAHVNPPRHFLRWDIGEVSEATSNGKSFMFTVVSSNGNSGFYEVKTEKDKQASRIQEAFDIQTFEILHMTEFPTHEEVKRYVDDQTPSRLMQMKLVSPPITPSAIDPTTGEHFHMNIHDLQTMHPSAPPLKIPNHLPLHPETTTPTAPTTKKNCTPPSPSSSQGSPVTQKPRKKFYGPKLITSPRRTPTPEIPCRTSSRTTSCVMSEVSPTVSKQFSMSTGNLRDPSPTFFNNHRLSGHSSGNNSPDVPISAKQLPLPNPPLPFFPGGRNSPHLHHPKPPSIDENSVYNAGSMSSLASQSPTLSTPTSLSDEEIRYPSITNSNHGNSNHGTNNYGTSNYGNGNHGTSNYGNDNHGNGNHGNINHAKEHTRSTSDVGVNYQRGQYQRSTSLSSEPSPPSLAGHIAVNIPQYINLMESADPVYINVSKRDDVYENPPMFHEEYSPENSVPPIPPKGARPDRPPWQQRRPTSLQEDHREVSDILNVILDSKRQVKGSDMGMTYNTFNKLCYSMDVESIGRANDWKGLAGSIGIEKNADIQMIDAFSTRHRQSPTDIVLYYWYCQINPPRPHCISELKAILNELEREDILEIITSQET